MKYSLEKHKRLYQPLAKLIMECFQPGSNVMVLLQHALDVMMNMALKVFASEPADR